MRCIVQILVVVASFAATLAYTPEYVEDGLSGTGTTTRYWDCCKPSCAWIGNTNVDIPVASCAADGVTVVDPDTMSGCVDGTSYMCNNQQATVVNDTFALGFTAASFSGGAEFNHCCICLLLSFQGAISNKQMVVQVTNTGGDLGQNHFDIAIPGGGVGLFTDGCATQWDAPPNGWGDQYGGVHSEEECSELPTVLQPGCEFRFEFLAGADNPAVTFDQVRCPTELTSLSGCLEQ